MVIGGSGLIGAPAILLVVMEFVRHKDIAIALHLPMEGIIALEILRRGDFASKTFALVTSNYF